MLVKPAQIFFQTKIANDVSLDFSFVNVYFFYLHGDNGSGISNVVETNKNLNTKQNHWVVPIRWHLLVFSLFRTIALFLLRNTLYFVLVSGLIGSQHENVVQLDHLLWKRTTNSWSRLMSGVKSVSRHEGTSAGGGSFAQQGGLIVWPN